MKTSSIRKVPVDLLAGGNEGAGWAEVCYWSDAEKTKRGLFGLGFSWSLAVLSVLLFMAHFILLPAFVILGPVLFFWARKQEGQFIRLVADCPFCLKSLALETKKVNLAWPLRVVCRNCFEPVRIDPQENSVKLGLTG